MQSAYVAGIYEILEFGQQRVKKAIADLTPEQLAKVPPGLRNSIATLAVHVAAVEVNFAHRLKGEATPDDLKAEYLLDRHQDPLPAPEGETVESLTAKMEKARAMLKETLSRLTDEDLNRVWTAPNGNQVPFRRMVTILGNHQAQHLGHIQYIRMLNG